MRDKLRRVTRQRPRSRSTVSRPVASSGVGTARWVLDNEAGWGAPHYWVAVLAAMVVGLRAFPVLLGRLAAWIAAQRGRNRA